MRSRARPRWIRLLTVPGGMSSVDGDLGVVETHDIAQDERGAEVGREGAQRVLDVVGQTLRGERGVGVVIHSDE